MFHIISNLLNLFISPITWMLLLLIGYFIVKKKTWKKRLLFACIGVFLIFTNSSLFAYIRYQMIKDYTIHYTYPSKHYKIAVVMGGFSFMNEETGQLKYQFDRAERLWEAVRLYKTGNVDHILITGDAATNIRRDGTSTAELFYKYMEDIGIPRGTFILEQNALNTRENALFSVRILRSMNISENECILITSATHMKRSLASFEKENYKPDYLPVNLYRKPEEAGFWDFYPQWSIAVQWQELTNEWIGKIVYKVMNYY